MHSLVCLPTYTVKAVKFNASTSIKTGKVFEFFLLVYFYFFTFIVRQASNSRGAVNFELQSFFSACPDPKSHVKCSSSHFLSPSSSCVQMGGGEGEGGGSMPEFSKAAAVEGERKPSFLPSFLCPLPPSLPPFLARWLYPWSSHRVRLPELE